MARRGSKSNIDVSIRLRDDFSGPYNALMRRVGRSAGRIARIGASPSANLNKTYKQIQNLIKSVNDVTMAANAAGSTVKGALQVGGQKSRKDLEAATRSAVKLQKTLSKLADYKQKALGPMEQAGYRRSFRMRGSANQRLARQMQDYLMAPSKSDFWYADRPGRGRKKPRYSELRAFLQDPANRGMRSEFMQAMMSDKVSKGVIRGSTRALMREMAARGGISYDPAIHGDKLTGGLTRSGLAAAARFIGDPKAFRDWDARRVRRGHAPTDISGTLFTRISDRRMENLRAAIGNDPAAMRNLEMLRTFQMGGLGVMDPRMKQRSSEIFKQMYDRGQYDPKKHISPAQIRQKEIDINKQLVESEKRLRDERVAQGRAAKEAWKQADSQARLRAGALRNQGMVSAAATSMATALDAVRQQRIRGPLLATMTGALNVRTARQARWDQGIATGRENKALWTAMRSQDRRERWKLQGGRAALAHGLGTVITARQMQTGMAGMGAMRSMGLGAVGTATATAMQRQMIANMNPLNRAFMQLGRSVGNITKKYPKLGQAMDKTSSGFKKLYERIRYERGPEGEMVKRDFTGKLERWRNYGFTLSAATMPIQMFAQQATHLQRDFIGNLNFIASVTEGTAEAMRGVQETALFLGRTKPYTSSQVAGAMANLALSGLTIPETTGLIGTVLDMASAGRTGVEFAGQSAAAAMRATGRTPAEMQKVADIYAKTQASTSATIRDLSISSRQILGLASAAGHTTEELFAIIGLLRNLGQIPSTIGVYMRQILSFMARGRIQKDLRRMGVDVEGSRKSFLTLVKELERVNADADKIMEIFLGPSGSLLNLLMNIGSTRIEKLVEELKASDGFAKKVAARQESGIYGAYRRMASAREGMMHAAMEGWMGSALETWANIRFGMYSGAAGSPFWSNVIGTGTLAGNVLGSGVTYGSQIGLSILGLKEVGPRLKKWTGALLRWIRGLTAARAASDALTAAQLSMGAAAQRAAATNIAASTASARVTQANLKTTAATAAAAGAVGRTAWLSLAGPVGWILAAAGIAATGFGIYKLWQAGSNAGAAAPATQTLTGGGVVNQFAGAGGGFPGGAGQVDVNVNLSDPGNMVESLDTMTEGPGMTTNVKMDKGFAAGAVA